MSFFKYVAYLSSCSPHCDSSLYMFFEKFTERFIRDMFVITAAYDYHFFGKCAQRRGGT